MQFKSSSTSNNNNNYYYYRTLQNTTSTSQSFFHFSSTTLHTECPPYCNFYLIPGSVATSFTSLSSFTCTIYLTVHTGVHSAQTFCCDDSQRSKETPLNITRTYHHAECRTPPYSLATYATNFHALQAWIEGRTA